MKKTQQKKFKKLGKMVTVLLVLIGGLAIVNMNSSLSFNSLTASQEDYEKSAEVVSNYIVKEYQKQVALVGEENVNLGSIIQEGKKFNEYGLTINYSEDSTKVFVIFKDLGDRQVVFKRVELQ